MDYFLIATVTFGLLLIYTLIQSRSTWYLYIIIPIVLISGVAIYFTYNSILGYPTTASSPKKFILITHITNEENIYMWVMHHGELQPRAYELPYTEEAHAQLEAAKESQQQGQMVEGEFESELEAVPGSIGANKSEGAEFKLYKINPQNLLPPKEDSPTTSQILNHSPEPVWEQVESP